MKAHDKYRFSLQWGAETAEKVQAGDFLESLGNRKSEFIILAVSEYLSAHPETLSTKQKLQIVIKPVFSQEQIRAMVMAVIEEKISGVGFTQPESSNPANDCEAIQPDVDEMLKNLALF